MRGGCEICNTYCETQCLQTTNYIIKFSCILACEDPANTQTQLSTTHTTKTQRKTQAFHLPLPVALPLHFPCPLARCRYRCATNQSTFELAFPETLPRTQAPVERVIAIPQIHSVLLAIIFPHLLLQTNRSNKNLPSIYTEITSCTPSVKSTTASFEAELVAPRE